MDRYSGEIVFAQMKTRQKGKIPGIKSKGISLKAKQRLRNFTISAAAVFCLALGAAELMTNGEQVTEVMSHVSTDFEYDETLGRLQFVSSILPDSAVMYMGEDDNTISVFSPCAVEVSHGWSPDEPWIEYEQACDIAACSDAEVMTVIGNRDHEYTIRLLHNDGYESVYSGLTSVTVEEYDRILAGDIIGQSNGTAAFELRKDGLSVLPQFESTANSRLDI